METLRRLRTERGLSQARLAARAELDPSTVNQIERGAREASPATLHKLADALDVGLYELLEGEPSPKAPGPSLPESLLRSRTGHRYLTHSLAETVAFATSASQHEIRTRLRDLSEEQAVLREALRHRPEYAPELFEPPPSDKMLPHAKDIEEVRRAKDAIGAVAGGFVVRVMTLAEIGGRKDGTGDSKDLIAEAERILQEEHAAVY